MARPQFKIGGMHCSFCSQSIERAYKRTNGVQKVSVSLAHEETLIEYDETLASRSLPSESQLAERVAAAGFEVK